MIPSEHKRLTKLGLFRKNTISNNVSNYFPPWTVTGEGAVTYGGCIRMS
jgi:hypothetical protein